MSSCSSTQLVAHPASISACYRVGILHHANRSAVCSRLVSQRLHVPRPADCLGSAAVLIFIQTERMLSSGAFNDDRTHLENSQPRAAGARKSSLISVARPPSSPIRDALMWICTAKSASVYQGSCNGHRPSGQRRANRPVEEKAIKTGIALTSQSGL